MALTRVEVSYWYNRSFGPVEADGRVAVKVTQILGRR